MITPSLLHEIVEKCMKNSIEFFMSPDIQIYEPGDDIYPCSGFFQAPTILKPGFLGIACGSQDVKMITETVLHELCHLDQFIENDKKFLDCMFPDGNDASKYLYGSLERNKSGKTKEELARIVLEAELDCERRVLQKIQEHHLSWLINADQHIKNINPYLYSHTWIMETGKILPCEALNHPAVIEACPSHLDNDYTKLPEKIKNAIIMVLNNE